MISNFPSYVKDHLIPFLRLKVQSFRTGQVSLFYAKWMQLTTDPHILRTIADETIEFSSYPIQPSYSPNSVCKGHVALVEAEICSLQEKEVIVPCQHELGEFISPIFSVPKKDGSVRVIHNLKKLNSFVENSHFKMESIHTVLNLVTPKCWMASLDFRVKQCKQLENLLRGSFFTFIYNRSSNMNYFIYTSHQEYLWHCC